jgi:hypothetical protein
MKTNPTHKRCTKCNDWLPSSSFRRNRSVSTGLSSWCKACHVERTRQWHEDNPEAVRAFNKARRIPPAQLTCVECGKGFEGRKDTLTCSRRCKDKRYARLHPGEGEGSAAAEAAAPA